MRLVGRPGLRPRLLPEPPAAEVPVDARGDAGTGWSIAYKLNLWARLRDGDRCEKILRTQLAPVTATGIDMKTGRPIRNEKVAEYWKDPEKKARLIQPAFWGAHDWQPMSYNPDTGLVYIPAHIMSAYYEHIPEAPKRNPFKSMYQLGLRTGDGVLLFPGEKSRSIPISDNTLRAALQTLGYGSDVQTVHGFRATARTLLDEVLEFDPLVIEAQLAHAVKDANGRAYNRTTYLKQRADMMQRWADYLDKLTAGADVIPLHRAA